jgi:hypothetical protein
MVCQSSRLAVWLERAQPETSLSVLKQPSQKPSAELMLQTEMQGEGTTAPSCLATSARPASKARSRWRCVVD